MWRTITRLRQSVSAYTRINNESVPNSPQNQAQVLQDKRSLWSRKCWQDEKCCCGSKSRNGEERRDHRARHGGPYYQAKHDWLDTFGWVNLLLFNSVKIDIPAEWHHFDKLVYLPAAVYSEIFAGPSSTICLPQTGEIITIRIP